MATVDPDNVFQSGYDTPPLAGGCWSCLACRLVKTFNSELFPFRKSYSPRPDRNDEVEEEEEEKIFVFDRLNRKLCEVMKRKSADRDTPCSVDEPCDIQNILRNREDTNTPGSCNDVFSTPLVPDDTFDESLTPAASSPTPSIVIEFVDDNQQQDEDALHECNLSRMSGTIENTTKSTNYALLLLEHGTGSLAPEEDTESALTDVTYIDEVDLDASDTEKIANVQEDTAIDGNIVTAVVSLDEVDKDIGPDNATEEKEDLATLDDAPDVSIALYQHAKEDNVNQITLEMAQYEPLQDGKDTSIDVIDKIAYFGIEDTTSTYEQSTEESDDGAGFQTADEEPLLSGGMISEDELEDIEDDHEIDQLELERRFVELMKLFNDPSIDEDDASFNTTVTRDNRRCSDEFGSLDVLTSDVGEEVETGPVDEECLETIGTVDKVEEIAGPENESYVNVDGTEDIPLKVCSQLHFEHEEPSKEYGTPDKVYPEHQEIVLESNTELDVNNDLLDYIRLQMEVDVDKQLDEAVDEDSNYEHGGSKIADKYSGDQFELETLEVIQEVETGTTDEMDSEIEDIVEHQKVNEDVDQFYIETGCKVGDNNLHIEENATNDTTSEEATNCVTELKVKVNVPNNENNKSTEEKGMDEDKSMVEDKSMDEDTKGESTTTRSQELDIALQETARLLMKSVLENAMRSSPTPDEVCSTNPGDSSGPVGVEVDSDEDGSDSDDSDGDNEDYTYCLPEYSVLSGLKRGAGKHGQGEVTDSGYEASSTEPSPDGRYVRRDMQVDEMVN